jgi:hypothetical protein
VIGPAFGSTNTDANNHYRFNVVPVGKVSVVGITVVNQNVQVPIPCGSGTVAAGQTVTIDCLYSGYGFVIVTVVDPAGNPLSGIRVHFGPVIRGQTELRIGPQFTFFTPASGTVSTYFTAGSYLVTAEDPVSGLGNTATGTVAVNGRSSLTITIQSAANGTVKGVISYDGTATVPFPNVFLTQVDSSGNTQTFYNDLDQSLTANGQYRFVGVGAGPFTVTSQADTGLTTTTTGSVADPSVPTTLNNTMPPSGIVTGTVSVSGVAQPSVQVNFESEANYFTVFRQTNSLGVYTIDGVLPKPFLVADNTGKNFAAGAITSVPSTVSANLASTPGTISVSGTLFAQDGTTPVAGATVGVQSFSLTYTDESDTVTDNLGHYAAAGLRAGKMRITASAPGQGAFGTTPLVGFSELGSITGNTTAANVVLGNILDLAYSVLILNGDDGFHYTENFAFSGARLMVGWQRQEAQYEEQYYRLTAFPTPRAVV